MRRALFVMLSILALSFSSCATNATQTAAPDTAQDAEVTSQITAYTIVTSTSILGDITQQIVGESAVVTSLVGAESDAHVYEPSPADGVQMANASAVVAFGLELEPWFEELYASSGSKAPYIEASADITPLPVNKSVDDHADEHADESADAHADEHGHGEFDPHTWQDVQNVIKMVKHITTELSTIMPEHAATLESNASAYIATLNALDSEIAAQMAQIPAERRILVTNHDTMSYFATRYGLTVVGTVLGSVSTESSDPGANKIIELVTTIKESGAPAIFIEAFGNEDLVETIAREAGVIVAPALYTDALGKSGSAGQTYVDMMRYNSQTIYQALGETSGQ
ncbi:MAG: metal ABC transporter substrate-binding protein [Roseiflexaceae bacterium]